MRQRFLLLTWSALLLSIYACSGEIEPGTTAESAPAAVHAAVETARITLQPIVYEGVGTVQAGATINLASKMLGTVERIAVKEGDRVKTGDTLIVIDQRQVEAGYSQAVAGLSEAKKAMDGAISSREAAAAAERLALATYERYLNLKKENAVSAQEFDEVEAGYRQAQAGLNRAEAMVESAAARIRQAEAGVSAAEVIQKDAVVTAPHEGVISGKFVEEGDLASPGTPLLNLDTTLGYRVDMVLPEAYIEHVQPGQQAIVIIPALKKETLEGTIHTIVPAADQRSRSFLIKISLPLDIQVKSGMFARVHIPLGSGKMLLIPVTAVLERGQLTGLYVIDDNAVAHFRLIRLGKTFQDRVEVLSGLKEGDRFVAEPDPKLMDGAKVQVSS